MSDLIERQAAIDMFQNLAYDDWNQGAGTTWANAYSEAAEMVKNLPPAQPNLQPTCNQLANDTISRQAAIAVTWKNPSYYDPLNVLTEVRDRIEALPSAQPEQRWIPCSERLPEEKDAGILKKLGKNKKSDYVIATVEVKGERMTVITCMYDGAWDWNMKYAFSDYKVIAWMPFPEPYKDGVERER